MSSTFSFPIATLSSEVQSKGFFHKSQWRLDFQIFQLSGTFKFEHNTFYRLVSRGTENRATIFNKKKPSVEPLDISRVALGYFISSVTSSSSGNPFFWFPSGRPFVSRGSKTVFFWTGDF